MGLKTLEKNSGKQGFGNEVKFSRKYRKDIPNNTSNILWGSEWGLIFGVICP